MNGITGTRLANQIVILLKAHALRDDRTITNKSDIEQLKKFLIYMNFKENPIMKSVLGKKK